MPQDPLPGVGPATRARASEMPQTPLPSNCPDGIPSKPCQGVRLSEDHAKVAVDLGPESVSGRCRSPSNGDVDPRRPVSHVPPFHGRPVYKGSAAPIGRPPAPPRGPDPDPKPAHGPCSTRHEGADPFQDPGNTLA